MITQQRLNQALSYDPDTGEFTWLEKRRGVKCGEIAGRVSKQHGYRDICVDRVLYRAHRLAFMAQTGAFPPHDVDHINGDRADNRWRNLRAATRSQNMANVGLQADNTSGIAGVVWDKDRGLWRAQIRIDGRKKNLGRFADKEAAASAVRNAASAQWGEYARG